jgi:hypothetical protein
MSCSGWWGGCATSLATRCFSAEAGRRAEVPKRGGMSLASPCAFPGQIGGVRAPARTI